MKKIFISMVLCIFFMNSYSQDKTQKKMQKKSETTKEKIQNKADTVSKKLDNKTDSTVKKVYPKAHKLKN